MLERGNAEEIDYKSISVKKARYLVVMANNSF